MWAVLVKPDSLTTFTFVPNCFSRAAYICHSGFSPGTGKKLANVATHFTTTADAVAIHSTSNSPGEYSPFARDFYFTEASSADTHSAINGHAKCTNTSNTEEMLLESANTEEHRVSKFPNALGRAPETVVSSFSSNKHKLKK